MPEKKDHLKWIITELPFLHQQGIISEDTAERLENYYREKLEQQPSSVKIFSLILTLLGIIMAAGGIVLFLNHNWDMFSKPLRISISAVPLAIGAVLSYFTILREKGQLWKECSAILTAAGTAVLTAMLSQIYHINGELADFTFLVLMLSVPVLYIFNSIGLATLFVLFSFNLNSWSSTASWQSGIAALAFLPFLFYHLRKNSPYKVWCRYLALPLALMVTVGCGKYYITLPMAVIIGIFLTAGMDLASRKSGFFKNPWLIPAFAVQTLLLAIASSDSHLFRIPDHASNSKLWIYWIFTGITALIFIRVFLQKRLTAERLLCPLMMVLTLIPFFTREPVMQTIFNVFFGLSGILYLRSGIQNRSLLIFNAGAVMIGVFTACRFFDSDIGVLYRSAGFILLGLGFIAANYFYLRRNSGRA